MKNIATNSLNYVGTVIVYKYSGKKKTELTRVHNAGNSPLFSFMTDCLLGNFDTAKLKLPNKIMLLNEYKEDNTAVLEARSAGFIPLVSAPEKVINSQDDGSAVAYSFIVQYDQIIGNFNRIALYSRGAEDMYNYSAICEISDEDRLNNMSLSSALVIEWQLSITNKPVETPGVSGYTAKEEIKE